MQISSLSHFVPSGVSLWLLKVQPQGKINLGADYQSQGNTLSSVVDNAKANMDLYLEKGQLKN